MYCTAMNTMSYIPIEMKSKGCFYRGQTHGQTDSVLVSTAASPACSCNILPGLSEIGGPTTPLQVVNMFIESGLGYECTYYA